MIKNYIKTPLNYTGNKFRLLEQLHSHFPKQINTMVDLFCGGTTVGLNTECKEVYFIDNEPRVIGLLQFFYQENFETLLNDIENIIDIYGLSNSYRKGYAFYKLKINDKNSNNGLKEYNSKAFYQLRADYNALLDKTCRKSYIMLYILLLYGFNNDLRFNAKGEFNLPVGKTDLNKTNVEKLRHYMLKIKAIKPHYICADFSSKEVEEVLAIADFIYMDPPYLITNATYNEANKWDNLSEHKLLALLDKLILENKQFILSNVLSKKNRMNEPLFYWTQKSKDSIEIIHMQYSYRSSSYNKKIRDGNEDEIIIKLKKAKNETQNK